MKLISKKQTDIVYNIEITESERRLITNAIGEYNWASESQAARTAILDMLSFFGAIQDDQAL